MVNHVSGANPNVLIPSAPSAMACSAITGKLSATVDPPSVTGANRPVPNVANTPTTPTRKK